MVIKTVCFSDIPTWVLLSKEYDEYVREVVPDLTEWYGGNGATSLSFDDYMKRKLDTGKTIRLNELKSNANQIQKIYTLLNKFGFVYHSETLENGVPVNGMEKHAK